MEARPPDQACGGPRAAAGVTVVDNLDASVIELAVRGRWSRPLAVDVCTVLRGCLAQNPAAMIVDLSGLSDLDAASSSMWVTASRAASALRPPTRVALCLPPTRRLAGHLRRIGATPLLPIRPTMEQAREAVAGPPPPVHRLQLDRLGQRPDSAGAAAEAVAVACTAWGRPDLVDTGRQVMTELVGHAGDYTTVTISLRGTDLHLAVREGDRRPPGPRAAGNTRPAPGGGSRTDSLASAWGATPTHDGKVIRAVVRGHAHVWR